MAVDWDRCRRDDLLNMSKGFAEMLGVDVFELGTMSPLHVFGAATVAVATR